LGDHVFGHDGPVGVSAVHEHEAHVTKRVVLYILIVEDDDGASVRDGVAEDLEVLTFGLITVETLDEHFPWNGVLNNLKAPLFAEGVDEVKDGGLDLAGGEFSGIEGGDFDLFAWEAVDAVVDSVDIIEVLSELDGAILGDNARHVGEHLDG